MENKRCNDYKLSQLNPLNNCSLTHCRVISRYRTSLSLITKIILFHDSLCGFSAFRSQCMLSGERGGKMAERENKRWLITIEINVRAAASVGRSRRPDNAAEILAGVTRKKDAIYKP